MPATPAWPPSSAPRLFVDVELREGLTVALEGGQAHYLANVMRAKPGDAALLFDDRTGEWLGEVVEAGRRAVTLTVRGSTKLREIVPDLWLCAAPIRKGRIDWVAEKACELGVARLVPVLTRRGVIDRVNTGRLRAHMIEAAEQCGRTALPELVEPVALASLLKAWPGERALYFADEEGGAAARDAMKPGPAAILIGPEGGFDSAERTAIRALSQAVAIGLGPRILRADTAAAAAIAVWMAVAGDWA